MSAPPGTHVTPPLGSQGKRATEDLPPYRQALSEAVAAVNARGLYVPPRRLHRLVLRYVDRHLPKWSARPPWWDWYSLTYADPTGETAARNADRKAPRT